MELLVLWLMMAGLAAYIASQKNRNVVAWFLIGCGFSLVGVIAIAAVPALPKKEGGE